MSLLLVGRDGAPFQRIRIPPGFGEAQRTATALLDGVPMTSPQLQAMLDSGEVYYGILPDSAYLPLYTGQPGFSYAVQAWVQQGIPRFVPGGPLQPPNDGGYPIGYTGPRGTVAIGEGTSSYGRVLPTAQAPLLGGGNGGTMTGDRRALIRELLAEQPVIARAAAGVAVAGAAAAGAATLADFDDAAGQLATTLVMLGAVREYSGSVELADLVQGQQASTLDTLSALSEGPAGTALKAAAGAVVGATQAKVPATADIGPDMAPMITAVGVFAAAVAGPFATLGGSLTTGGVGSLGIVLLMQRGGGAFGEGFLFQALLLGPAVAAFQAACATAATALAASATFAAAQAALAPWVAAAATYFAALQQARLLAAIL